MSDATRWRHVEALLDEAAHLAPPERPDFLDRACRKPDGTPDAALREEVEALLALDPDAALFFKAAHGRLASVAGRLADGDEAPRDTAPERVGAWRLVREVGRGGMGTVFLAERADGRFEQTAAVKLVRPGLAAGLVERFRSERQILARLDHPAIARLLDGGQTDDGRPFLVMEYVDGEPVTDYCDRRRLGVNERLALFESICEAVQFAHTRLVVHRDLKPSNVLVAETDAGPRVKLLDFGIAKLLQDDGTAGLETAPDQRVMTPEYAAPEQIRGDAVTTATDVYALGVLLYELLTGRRPHAAAGGRHAVERAILDTEPARPSEAVTESAPTGGRVPADPAQPEPGRGAAGGTGALRSTTADRLRRRLRGDLDRIALRALCKEPERRYDGAAALSADVRRHLDGLPVEARPDTAGYRIGKFVRRHRAGAAAGLVALLAVVGGAGAALWQAGVARDERDRAEAQAVRAERTAEYLEGVFAAGDPANSPGTTTVRDLLAAGLEQADALDAEPEAQAALLMALGRSATGASLDSLAGNALGRAEALQRALRPGPHAGLAEALAAQARLHALRDRFAPADSLYRLALATYAAGEPMRTTEARLLVDFAALHQRLGTPADAERLGRQAVTTARAAGDAEATANALAALALNRIQTDRAEPPPAAEFRAAAALLDEAHVLRIRAFGAGDPRAAITYGQRANLAATWGEAAREQGQTRLADSLARRALADAVRLHRIYDSAYGPDDARSVRALGNRGLYMRDVYGVAASLPISREVHARSRRSYGPAHGITAMAAGNLQADLAEVGRPAEALPFAREAAEIAERLGSAPAIRASAWANVGDRAAEAGRHAEACAAYRRGGEPPGVRATAERIRAALRRCP